MLLWALGQVLLARAPAGAALSASGRFLYALVLTALAAGITTGLYWVLTSQSVRLNLAVRLAASIAAAAFYLVALSLAAGLALPAGPWSRVLRSDYLLSTALLSVLMGWLLARDPFGLLRTTDRVYLTPAEYQALAPADRERLSLDTTQGPASGPSGPAG